MNYIMMNVNVDPVYYMQNVYVVRVKPRDTQRERETERERD